MATAAGGAAVVYKARAAAAHHVMPSPQSPPYTAETAAAKKKELAGSSAGDRCASPALLAVRAPLATLAASSNPIQLTSKCAGERRELLHGNYSDTN